MPEFRSTDAKHASVESQRNRTSYSPCKRSIPQACAQSEHQWHHSTNKPAIPHVDAPFGKHPGNTYVGRKNITQQNQLFPMQTLDSTSTHTRQPSVASRHNWHNPTSHFPCRRQIWKIPGKTHVGGITTQRNQLNKTHTHTRTHK